MRPRTIDFTQFVWASPILLSESGVRNKILTLVLIYLIAVVSTAQGNADARKIDHAYGQAVSGDVRPILSFLEKVNESERSEYAELAVKYNARFIEGSEQFVFEDPFISELHRCFRIYWRASLLDPDSERRSNKELKRNLKRLLRDMGSKSTGSKYNRIEAEIKRLAEARGYHILMGVTPPLRELKVWKKEERIKYEVKLPDESFSVDLVFLQDFVCNGWLGFATFNRSHTGGWATDHEIYRVGGKPSDDDEWFRVSLIGHEGRHVSDRAKYGSMPGWEREYRAKLTELIIADKTFWKLLNRFKNVAKPDKSAPHSYASYLITKNLIGALEGDRKSEELSSFDFEAYNIERLQGIAAEFLNESTRSLEN